MRSRASLRSRCAAGLVAIAAGNELSAPPAECGCECDEASGFQCSVTVTEAGAEYGFLVFNPEQWTLDSGECQLVDTVANAFTAGIPALDPSGGSCAPMANDSIAQAAFGVNLQACVVSRTPAGTCGGTVSYASGCAGLATLHGSDEVPGCGEANSELNALRYIAAPDVDCSPSGGLPTGDVTPTGATTVCCLP